MSADPPIAPTRADPDLIAGSEALGGPAGNHRAPAVFWTPLRVILAVGAVVYWLGFLRTYPCMSNGWTDPDRYEAMCYSDIPVLYGLRGLQDGLLPILQWPAGAQPLEYPPLTAVWAWLLHHPAALISDGSLTYYVVTAVAGFALFLAALAATAATVPGRVWDGMMVAVAPSVLLAPFINWDLAPVAMTALALLAWSRGNPTAAGVALGIGAAFKLYPALLLGPLLLLCWRAGRLAAFGWAAAGAVGAWLAVNVPFAVANFEGWSYFFRFSAERGRDFGSVWLALDTAGLSLGPDTVNRAAVALMLLLCAGIAALIWWAPRKPRLAQVSFLVVAAFLLTNKVYSPQFVLWLLPLAVLARPRWRDFIWWQVAEAVYFAGVWWYLVGLSGGERGLTAQWYAGAIAVHVVATAALCALVVRDILRPQHDPVRSDGRPSHRDDPGGGPLDQHSAANEPQPQPPAAAAS